MLLLYERLKLYHEVLRCYMEAGDHRGLIVNAARLGHHDPNLWLEVLSHLAARQQDCSAEARTRARTRGRAGADCTPRQPQRFSAVAVADALSWRKGKKQQEAVSTDSSLMLLSRRPGCVAPVSPHAILSHSAPLLHGRRRCGRRWRTSSAAGCSRRWWCCSSSPRTLAYHWCEGPPPTCFSERFQPQQPSCINLNLAAGGGKEEAV